jgi:hypothetical protein
MKKYNTRRRKIEKLKHIIILWAFLTGSMLIFGNWIAFSGYETPKIEVKHVEVKHKEKTAVKIIELTTNNPEVETTIRETAERMKFKDINLLLAIAQCESGLVPTKINNNGVYGQDRGLFQFNNKYNPHVTNEMAFDPKKATELAISEINAGNLWKWKASKYCQDKLLAKK